MTLAESPTDRSQVVLSGAGLITGLPVTATLERLAPSSGSEAGLGIAFSLADAAPITATLDAVVHADRGVTLGGPDGGVISLIEHFLAACALSGARDVRLRVEGAPELPILDGSAAPWREALRALGFHQPPEPSWSLRQAVFYRHNDAICLYAVPAPHFQLTYAVDFPHPGLQGVWSRWDCQEDGPADLMGARTFGFVRELPALLAKGLARGATLDNTLGLTDEGGFTTPLRMAEEPVRHKMLDFLGDLMLCGINPLAVQAHVVAINAGHASHIAFARQWRAALQAVPASAQASGFLG